ncbi:MAG: prepilin-type N-terminal cleavage/methylation domain-containing protein [Candidatus Aminicenantes bacterium]
MEKKLNLNQTCRRGFTLIEFLVGSAVMLVVVIGTLQIYQHSNRISVDQQQFAELQHDVRSGMFFIQQDARSAGVGLPMEFAGYFIEGTDNEDQGAEVTPDRLLMMGNLEDPLNLRIDKYMGSAANLTLEDYSYEQYPYPDDYYEEMVALILPNPDSGCRAGEVREITHVTHSATGTNERINFSHGLSKEFNPPGGLGGTCPSSNDYNGGMVAFINVKEYWLDVTGNYPGLTAGENGYIGNGVGNVLYVTHNGVHRPVAQNIENLQFQYNGDMDGDGMLDGFTDWDPVWTGDPDMAASITHVRVQIVGRTPNRFVSLSGSQPPNDLHLYRRPALANTPAASEDDLHRRFMLEAVASVRNRGLTLYNFGER